MMLRGARGNELAEACGVKPSYVSMLRSGTRAEPSRELALKLAAALRISAEWLITGRGDSPGFTEHLERLRANAEATGNQDELDRLMLVPQNIWQTRALAAEAKLDTVAAHIQSVHESLGSLLVSLRPAGESRRKTKKA